MDDLKILTAILNNLEQIKKDTAQIPDIKRDIQEINKKIDRLEVNQKDIIKEINTTYAKLAEHEKLIKL